MTPEKIARHLIERQSKAAGWIVQNYHDLLHITEGLWGVTEGLWGVVREFPLKTGKADYLLHLDAQIVGMIDAKPEDHPLVGVETQSAKYTPWMPSEYLHGRLLSQTLRAPIHPALSGRCPCFKTHSPPSKTQATLLIESSPFSSRMTAAMKALGMT